MAEHVYDRLASIFDAISFGGQPKAEMAALLRALFSDKEAQVAIHLSPLKPEPPSEVAERMGEDPDAVASILDRMAAKGLIYCSQRDGDRWYKVIQLFPGIFELQFMRGEVTPRTKELARLFDGYFGAQEKRSQKEAITPFARVIPVEKTVSAGIEVFPYEEASRYIDAAEFISVSTCYCRHKQRLLDKGCAYPDAVCLQFGPFARFLVQRGFGRLITRQEAHGILRQSEEAGLVHTSNNTRDHIDFICNCCSCCCGILHSIKSSTMPSMAAASNYLAQVDEGACVGCRECVERCQMEAIFLDGDMAQIDTKRCIGCGVCVTGCPSEAIRLLARRERQVPPGNFKELAQRQMEEKRLGGLHKA